MSALVALSNLMLMQYIPFASSHATNINFHNLSFHLVANCPVLHHWPTTVHLVRPNSDLVYHVITEAEMRAQRGEIPNKTRSSAQKPRPMIWLAGVTLHLATLHPSAVVEAIEPRERTTARGRRNFVACLCIAALAERRRGHYRVLGGHGVYTADRTTDGEYASLSTSFDCACD